MNQLSDIITKDI